ncbi:hypothetical protein KP79_PYT23919 [Mizuhopecten yessoensis]|uniref:Uncharacterized protein n=1 Tax=Mizuhopecten yessoensis TaxID=6573 RepID=A0A210PZ13_MIZYE|nr:hypothetical protein KP79_PYT23919 [Mizuhopecten yessoensis]
MYLTDQTKKKMSPLHDGHFDEFVQTHIQHSRERRAAHDLSDQSQLTTDLEIAAIVLGVLFVLIIIFLIAYRLWKYYKSSRAPEKGRTSKNDNKNFMDINKNMERNKPSRTPSFERRIHPGNKTMDNSLKTKDNTSGMNPSNMNKDDNDKHYNNEKHTEEMSKEQRKLKTRLLEKRGSIHSFNKQQLQTISEDKEC